MDLILDNIYFIIIAAAGLVQWWKTTQNAKKEREEEQRTKKYFSGQVEERRQSRPVVPPPLPAGANPTPPKLDRSPAPMLKKVDRAAAEAKAFVNAPHYIQEAQAAELARQAAIAEQLSGLKQARMNKQEAIQVEKREKAKTVASGSIRDRLKNRSELRQAFVLKEFLEKPVGLR